VFIKIRQHYVAVGAGYFLELPFHCAPVCLDVVCAGSGGWIFEIPAVVHRGMGIAK